MQPGTNTAWQALGKPAKLMEAHHRFENMKFDVVNFDGHFFSKPKRCLLMMSVIGASSAIRMRHGMVSFSAGTFRVGEFPKNLSGGQSYFKIYVGEQ